MKPEEMRDDIPADVREALAELFSLYGGTPLREVKEMLEVIVRVVDLLGDEVVDLLEGEA